MSRLWSNETGLLVPGVGEWVSSYRWARTHLRDAPPGGGTLFVFAGGRPASDPLRVLGNSRPLGRLAPERDGRLRWRSLPVPPDVVGEDGLTVELRLDGRAEGWSLGLEATPEGTSTLSTDAGATWSDRVGTSRRHRGEYLVRFRSGAGADEPPPTGRWRAGAHPAADLLLERVPVPTGVDADALARHVASWAGRAVRYAASGDRLVYAPWDPNMVLDWSGPGRGFDDRPAVTMCVHEAVLAVSVLVAIGMPARCVVFTGGIGSFDGHFAAEYWSDRYGQWIYVDPTLQCAFEDGERPLSGLEVTRRRGELGRLAVLLPGAPDSLDGTVAAWWAERRGTGAPFARYGVWPGSDFWTEPGNTPPGHGATEYCETGIVWHASCPLPEFGMFRWFAPDEYFTRGPGSPA